MRTFLSCQRTFTRVDGTGRVAAVASLGQVLHSTYRHQGTPSQSHGQGEEEQDKQTHRHPTASDSAEQPRDTFGEASWAHRDVHRDEGEPFLSSPSSPSSSGPSQPIRTLYPQIKLRARTQERPWHTTRRTATMEDEKEEGEAERHHAHVSDAAVNTENMATSSVVAQAAGAASTATTASSSTSAPAPRADAADGHEATQGNDVQQFLEAVRDQVEVSRYERNQAIPFPDSPDVTAPLFRRIKKHKKMEVVKEDPDFPTFQRRDHAVALPPPESHPWVKGTPIGPYIVHGDGQINIHGGTGEVGFDDDPNAPDAARPLPRYFRGLQHRSVVGRVLPQANGKVIQDAVVRHSFEHTGRGVFATRDVKKGEILMVVQSTAQNTGVKGEINRLEEMIIALLRTAHGDNLVDYDEEAAEENVAVGGGGATVDAEAVKEARAFLHEWVLTGQPSALLEYWPAAATQRVVDAIGGPSVLYDLELHKNHIAELAAVLDLNSFLVESFYAERKGMAYFPEAGFLNHSCAPNATYDIIPAHTFKESDYYLDEAVERDNALERELEEVEAAEAAASIRSTSEARGDDTTKKSTGDHASTTSALLSPSAASETKNVAFLGETNTNYPDLTEADAPTYLFCCRATGDIKAGDEILISYVPPSWTFDNRQYVLHDRYHFWCKCPKCAPTLDKKYAKLPKFIIVVMMLCIFLQGLLLYQRDLKNAVDEDIDAIRALPEDERIEALRARGVDVKRYADGEANKKRRSRQKGFFEMLDEEKKEENNRFDDLEGRNPLVQRELSSQGVKW